MARAEDYEHLPIEYARLEWRDVPTKPILTGNPIFKGDRRERELGMDVVVHPNNSGRIIINYPGHRGDISGFNNKHLKLAQYMQGEGLGAVVRIRGSGFPDFNGFAVDTQLRAAIAYSLKHSEVICGAQRPEVLIIGTSAGGGAASAIAYEYERVSRILLMAPGDSIGGGAVEKGLGLFAGEVYIVIGEDDDVVGGTKAGQYYYELAARASRRELFILPNCNHQFWGELNGRYMSQAPFYAFATGDRSKFPDPEGGIVLY